MNLLLEVKEQANCPIYVVLTMRSDFLGDCTQFPGLAEAINAGQYLVPRMTRDERRAAIEGPIGVGGAEIAPVLLTRLVNDVGDNPDQLSILQHALNRTWARWQRAWRQRAAGPAALRGHRHHGPCAGSACRAGLCGTGHRTAAANLREAVQGAHRQGDRPPRRPAPDHLGQLCALTDATAAEVADVIDVFRDPSRSFLMPPAGEALEAETVIDISHESLMRVWERLIKWADEEAAVGADLPPPGRHGRAACGGQRELVARPGTATGARLAREEPAERDLGCRATIPGSRRPCGS